MNAKKKKKINAFYILLSWWYRILSLSCEGVKDVSKSKQVYGTLTLYFSDNLYSLTMTDEEP